MHRQMMQHQQHPPQHPQNQHPQPMHQQQAQPQSQQPPPGVGVLAPPAVSLDAIMREDEAAARGQPRAMPPRPLPTATPATNIFSQAAGHLHTRQWKRMTMDEVLFGVCDVCVCDMQYVWCVSVVCVVCVSGMGELVQWMRI